MEFKKPYKPQGRSSNTFNKFNQDSKRDFGPRKNEWIRVPRVRVIDSEGENLGEMETAEALRKARELELDLVEVSPNATPPVCRIIDFAKYQYEQSKKMRESRQKTKEMKEFRFSPVIDAHDIEIRVKRAKEFLSKGHNVRLTMVRKGRQTYEQALNMYNQILTNFADYSTIEPEKKTEGRSIFLTFKANGKTKNTKNSGKESQAIEPKGESKAKADVQQDSSTPLEN